MKFPKMKNATDDATPAKLPKKNPVDDLTWLSHQSEPEAACEGADGHIDFQQA